MRHCSALEYDQSIHEGFNVDLLFHKISFTKSIGLTRDEDAKRTTMFLYPIFVEVEQAG